MFNINGMGLLGYESVLERDYPVVLGILVISAMLLLIGNILSDICVALVDPRVKFS
jgi:microcin C transport system permease protein